MTVTWADDSDVTFPPFGGVPLTMATFVKLDVTLALLQV